MNWQNVVEIRKDVYWVGAKDWNNRLFDALIPLPQGTSYNSYLVIGESRRALVDTVFRSFAADLEQKVRKVANPAELDYIVMNHAEPDHASAIPHMMRISPKAKLVVTNKGAKMAKVYYGVPEDRMMVVSDQQTVDLGHRTLQFIEAPMLHWPETMFTYLREDGILFPCDFFGAHTAKGIFDDDSDDLVLRAKRYFGEIMMPYRPMAKKGLEKLANLKIKVIAPSHGPIYRNPERILAPYRKWTNGDTERKATIVYATMWGHTEAMIRPIADVLASEGVKVSLHNLAVADVGEIAEDIVDSRAIVIGTPTVLNNPHPLVANVSHLVKVLHPPARYALVVGSYGWAGGAVKAVAEALGQLGIDVVGVAEVNGPLSEEELAQINDLARELAKRMA